MATLRGARGQQGGVPWGWIIGLAVVLIGTAAIIWWTRAGSPGVGTSGQEGVEQRSAPATGQPGTQPGTPGNQPGTTQPPGSQPPPGGAPRP